MNFFLNILTPFIFLTSSVISFIFPNETWFNDKNDSTFFCNGDSLIKADRKKNKKSEEITIKVFCNKDYKKSANNNFTGFGYDIIISGSLYIHQPNIPSIPGNAGFTTKKKAKKTAKFIAKKIKNKIIPPTITRQELESLKVL